MKLLPASVILHIRALLTLSKLLLAVEHDSVSAEQVLKQLAAAVIRQCHCGPCGALASSAAALMPAKLIRPALTLYALRRC